MKLHVMLSAVALAAFAGTAHAQNTTGTGTTGTTTPGVTNGFNAGTVNNGFNNGFNSGFNNGFANPFQFVPNAGFVPPGGVPNPFINGAGVGITNGFNNGFGPGNGFAPGPGTGNAIGIDPVTGQPITSVGGSSLFNGFQPGFATGYFPYGYYGGYGYPGPINLSPNYLNGGGYGGGMAARRGGLPILGVNVPATAIPRAGRARVRQLTPTNDQRLADTDAGVEVVNPANPNPNTLGTHGTGDRTVSTGTPRDFGVVSQVSNMMASDRPLRGGRLMQVNGSDATVEVSMNGRTQTAYVPLNEVFFFRGDGEMATLAQNPRAIRAGGSVMVADPAQPLNPARMYPSTTPQQAVAGSRQTYNKMRVTNHVTKKSSKKSRAKHHSTK